MHSSPCTTVRDVVTYAGDVRVTYGDVVVELRGLSILAPSDHAVDLCVLRCLAATAAERVVAAERQRVPGSDSRAKLLAAAQEHVEANLGDPDLTPRRIAAAIYVSPRYLHALFSAAGDTVSRYVMRRRLETSLEHLLDPGRGHQSILHIATRLGFKDASHFARAFRKAFGTTPRAFRTCSIQIVDPGWRRSPDEI